MKNLLVLSIFSLLIQFTNSSVDLTNSRIDDDDKPIGVKADGTTYFSNCDASWGAKLADDKTKCICSKPNQTLFKISSKSDKSDNPINRVYIATNTWGCIENSNAQDKVFCAGGAKYDGNSCVCEDPSDELYDATNNNYLTISKIRKLACRKKWSELGKKLK